jgi:quercetin dioxygenase-like cupin family protein
MAAPERDAIERFARYWDALAEGAPGEPDLPDPALAATVARLSALDLAPDIDPAFQRRLEARLLDTGGASGIVPATPLLPVSGSPIDASPNGRVVVPPGRVSAAGSPRPIPWRWGLSQLATAALLLLTLLGSLIALRYVMVQRPTSYMEAVGRTQVDTLLDAAVVGAPDTSTPLAVERWTFPGGSGPLTVPPLDGPQWIVAEAGPLTATVDGVLQPLADGASLVVPAGQTLVVGNAGEEEATALRGVATSRFALEDYDRAAIRKETALDTKAHPALPAGASHVLFERLTLPPGAILRIEPVSGRDWIDVVSGQLGLTIVGDVLPAGWQSGQEREIREGELLPGMPVDTKVSLHNVGEEPLVLLRLRVTPLTEGAS